MYIRCIYGIYVMEITKYTVIYVGWPGPYMYTVIDRMYGNFPAKNAGYTPYKRMYGFSQPYIYGVEIKSEIVMRTVNAANIQAWP
jgi:hypothetical protein